MSFYYQKKHGHCGDMKKEEIKCEIELKEKCRKDKNGRMVVDFEYFVADPNIFDEAEIALTTDVETAVAAVTLRDVQKKSKVLLQGLFHLEAAEGDTAIVRIRKFTNGTAILSLGELIYETDEIALLTGTNQLSALHVDKDFRECEESVTYVLTVETTGAAAELERPITFTATEFN